MAVIQPLDSLDNKSVRTVRHLLTSRTFREKQKQAVLEGFHMVLDAVDAGALIHLVLYSQRIAQQGPGRSLLARLQAGRTRLVYVTDRVLSELSAVETHQGILAVVGMPKWPAPFPLPQGTPWLLGIAHEIQDPGNLGTLIRSFHAAGAHMMGLTKGTVDPFNPKALRASAGSVFKLPVVALDDSWLEDLAARGVQVITAVAEGGEDYTRMDWTRSVALVLGNEGAGLPDAVVQQSHAVTIPMVDSAESLNVAVAGSVLVFQAAAARRHAGLLPVPPVMIQ
ncbi:hypothetical protein BXT84_10150 [Sulfobacillus thermotolerans]|uniref:RNA 2-O ribose methyltransferase substrate binding domain-containing protein n=1 Tax=Sulfobacillus thermotolerans TaxID=338644 RepID=A0ABN5H316_9FIRM|nr:hypothetical protein BXT84_10150 [Sulfobacillus thermotolerans]